MDVARRWTPEGAFEAVPMGVFDLLIDMAVKCEEDSTQLPRSMQLMLVCKGWHVQIRRNQTLWKRLYFVHLDTQSYGRWNMSSKSWYQRCRKKAQIRRSRDKNANSRCEIENCDEFLCPVGWDAVEGDIESFEFQGKALLSKLCIECGKYIVEVSAADLDAASKLATDEELCIAIRVQYPPKPQAAVRRVLPGKH